MKREKMKWTVCDENSKFAYAGECQNADENDGKVFGVYPTKREALKKAKEEMRGTIVLILVKNPYDALDIGCRGRY